ncbi:hypothetical protein [Nocardia violaceofusca]|uniref:hypothetical protein n=2 Tax=Nocardia TaxID=1817 RepID=UPI000AE671FC|nr:hypothetical protein [Nocardia violaceofusca]
MTDEPDTPIDVWEPPKPAPSPPERPASEPMPPYPPSAGSLSESYPPFPPAAPQYHPMDHLTGYPQTAVPQPVSPPIMHVIQQYPPGAQIVVKRSFPHGLHLVLTLITCGLWSPIWLVHYLLADNS